MKVSVFKYTWVSFYLFNTIFICEYSFFIYFQDLKSIMSAHSVQFNALIFNDFSDAALDARWYAE